jgi:hypothetical protein
VHFHCLLPSFRLIVGQTTCCGNSYVAGDIRVAGRAEGSTPFVKRSLCDTRKERPILLGVKFAQITDRLV